MISRTKKLVILVSVTLLLIGCGEETVISESPAAAIQAENATDSFRMRNAEIRQDIINELTAQEIEHWINDDGSIGFNSEDAERVDAIGYAAIGAYAARN
ncbi:MAG: hypothetical protein GKR91_20630 [Pseudomonadales bacterium]|nr:hypothetical protein [Pseudomonadales bacterium]